MTPHISPRPLNAGQRGGIPGFEPGAARAADAIFTTSASFSGRHPLTLAQSMARPPGL